jgi:hypothetical protein
MFFQISVGNNHDFVGTGSTNDGFGTGSNTTKRALNLEKILFC